MRAEKLPAFWASRTASISAIRLSKAEADSETEAASLV
jgi:hypothetical protein